MATDAPERVLWRARLLAGVLALAAIMFRQDPGLIVPDTKLDLTAAPGQFLMRAMSMWDSHGALGQLQNQAYGYLFPVGPLHVLGVGAGLPEWVVQRLWWTTVAATAFLGFWFLARALRIGSPWARYFGAFAFALSPRFISEVAITSVEVWPMAMAPWVLLPLVNPRRSTVNTGILGSAVAFGLVGGVNAVATGATLVLPALWLLTRGPLRWSLFTFSRWLVLCLAAAMWWIVPLVQLGRYSAPFLDWIEDSRVTTSTASTFNAVQGTTPWLNFLSTAAGPSWPAGWEYVAAPLLVLFTGMMAVAGLVGLGRSDLPEARWLRLSLAVGLALLTVGFTGTSPGLLADEFQRALDGAMAPFRNIHKFEMVVRVPILLGLVHVAAKLRAPAVTGNWGRIWGSALAGLVLAAFAAPATASSLMARPEGYSTIPAHWVDAATWLDAQPDDGSVLVLPAASFADFTWGSTKDDPFQALLRRPYVVRDAVPLGSAGTTRMLDEIERQVGRGEGDAGLKATMKAAGIRFVVLRNDLRIDAQGSSLLAVHEALDESGIGRVASFGPPVGEPEKPESTINERTLLPYPSVEVFDVGQVETVRLVSQSDAARGRAAPEDVPLISSVLGAAPVGIFGSDAQDLSPALDSSLTLTDGFAFREVAFGLPAKNTSGVLEESDPGRTGRRTSDYVHDGAMPVVTRSWDPPISRVSTSSSASDADATLRLGPAYGPSAALDGDLATRWVSGTYLQARGEWFEIEFSAPRSLDGATIALSGESPVEGGAAELLVTTDHGSTTVAVPSDAIWRLDVPGPATSRVRVTLTQVEGPIESGFSIAELTIPGASFRSALTVPWDQDAGVPASMYFRVRNPGAGGCHFVAERPLCSPRFVQQAEEGAGLMRNVTLPAEAEYRWSGTVLPAGQGVNRLLTLPGDVEVQASSSAVPGAAGRPGTIVDRDLGTGWVAGSADPDPRIDMVFPRERTFSGLQFQVDPQLAASRPKSVQISLDGTALGEYAVDTEGYVRFAEASATRVGVRFADVNPTVNVDKVSGFESELPVGLSEMVILGADDLRRDVDSARQVNLPCGFGPSLRVNDRDVPSRVIGTVRDVLRGIPLAWEPCDEQQMMQRLAKGDNEVTAPATAEFLPYTLALTQEPARRNLTEARVDGTGRQVTLPARDADSVLVMSHNQNKGWSATTSEGARLVGVRVNGWQQGWLVPRGAKVVVTTEYLPQRSYRVGLVIGSIVLAAMIVALRRRQRGGLVAIHGAPDGVSFGVLLLPAVTLLINSGVVGVLSVAIGLAGALIGLGTTVRSALIGLTGGLAVIAVALNPWMGGGWQISSAFVHGLMLAAVALAVLTDYPGTLSRRLTQFRRGRSIHR